ncbi:MAG: YtxH domain-containing protein [Bacteroidota bacterium]
MKTSTKVALALGVGLVAGSILGVLYAPAKGSETREKFQRQRRKWRERFDRGMQTGQDILSKMSKRVDEEVGD